MGLQCVLFAARACRKYLIGLTSPHRHFSAAPTLYNVGRLTSVINGTPAFVNIGTSTCFNNGLSTFLRPLRREWRHACSFTSTAVVKDVLLFEHDRTRFFRLLAMFCGGQFLFWTYLAYFAFTGLRDTRKSTRDPQRVRTDLGLFSFDINLGSNAWRFGFTLGCLAIGGGIVVLGVLFSRRSVSRIILHKGGGKVTVNTQSPLGVHRAWGFTVPLNQVACHAHRQESPSYIPLKVKDHKFYFLLDKEGTLNNSSLFDVTVGAYRPL